MTNLTYSILINGLDVILSYIILHIYFKSFLTEHSGNYWRIVLWSLYFTWQIILMTNIEIPIYLKLLISSVLIVVMCCVLYSGNLLTKIILAVLISVFWTLMEFIVGYILLLVNVDFYTIQFYGTLFSKILTLGIIRVLQLFFKDENIQGLSVKYEIILLMVIVGNMLVVYNIFSLGIKYDSLINPLITLFIMLILNVLTFQVYLKLAEVMEIRTANAVYEQQLEMCTIHMQEKENLMLEFRNARHDMKQHMIVMIEYLENNEIDKAKEYLANFVEWNQFEKLGISRSDNIVIDAIINAKYMSARTNEIEFIAKVSIPIQLPFENGDLSILLGNILDNAIEASLKLEIKLRKINLIVNYDKNILIVVCKNNYTGNLIKDKSGMLLTNKQDFRNHGLGLRSVHKIADKYHGSVVVDYNLQEFVLKVILCSL